MHKKVIIVKGSCRVVILCCAQFVHACIIQIFLMGISQLVVSGLIRFSGEA
jgi:hypothetical protein